MNVSMLNMDMKVEYHGKLYVWKKKKGLKTLDLSRLGIMHITEIKGLGELTDLQVLFLVENRITEIKSLENLTNLEKLYLDNNQITEIKGLGELTDLKVLKLTGNQINDIKGLENLTNLEKLYLDKNQITEIKGLENLNKLSYLTLWKNPVFKSTKGKFGVTGGNEQYKDPLAVVEYSRLAPERREVKRREAERIETEKREAKRREAERIETEKREAERREAERIETERREAERREAERIEVERNEAERRERERKEKEEEEKRIKDKANQYIKKLSIAYKEINFEKISSKIGLEIKYLENIVEDMIINKEIDAEIHGDTLSFKKTIPELKKEVKTSQLSSEFNSKTIKILRGGDWKIKGNQSVFYYKVKVNNNSRFLIGNVQILLTSTPEGLKAQSQTYKIDSLKPGSFESPTFKLNATESCVGDTVESLVSYTDPMGNQQTVNVEPFEICYVCNLLTPKPITKEEFEEKIEFMAEKKLIIDSDLTVPDLAEIIGKKITECNFALLQQIKGSQREGFRKFEGFAQGLYDKEDVGLSIAVKKVEEGSKLVVRAMSDRVEKITDLLKDFSIKLDDIKSNTELIKEYTSLIEEIFNKQIDLEVYLKSHLASDWEKIKDIWQDYKTGKIERKELIKRGIKLLGWKFIKSIIPKILK